MLDGISSLTYVVFLAAVILAEWYLYKAAAFSRTVLVTINGWLLFITLLGLTGFYHSPEAVPPRIVLLVGPPLLLLVALFGTRNGRAFLDSLDLNLLTWMHVARFPIELTLFWLYEAGKVPIIMTFEGRNWDILSGLTAPLIAWYAFKGNAVVRPRLLLLWNVVCLALVVNIATHGLLSAESPFQQFAFDQPNIGVLYVPFNWLPGFLVPAVIMAHLVAIRRLLLSAATGKTG